MDRGGEGARLSCDRLLDLALDVFGRRLVDRAVASFDQRIDPEECQPSGDRELERSAERVERLFQPAGFGRATIHCRPGEQPADGEEVKRKVKEKVAS